MSTSKLIESFESSYLKKELPDFKIGDTVKVHTKIKEGQKERIQIFMGIVIAKKGSKLSETFTVYRNAYGCSMERVYLIHSPNVHKIEILKRGKVRRAKLYYLKGKSGKKAKVQEKIFVKKTKAPLKTKEKIEEVKESTEASAEEKKTKETKPKKPKE